MHLTLNTIRPWHMRLSKAIKECHNKRIFLAQNEITHTCAYHFDETRYIVH